MPTSKPGRPDRLGEFLTQYDEYLDGNRSYRDLPPAIRATANTDAASTSATDLVLNDNAKK
jgi:hypothetical protein